MGQPQKHLQRCRRAVEELQVGACSGAGVSPASVTGRQLTPRRACRYYDPSTVGLDFEGMTEDIKGAPNGAVVVLHGEAWSARAGGWRGGCLAPCSITGHPQWLPSCLECCPAASSIRAMPAKGCLGLGCSQLCFCPAAAMAECCCRALHGQALHRQASFRAGWPDGEGSVQAAHTIPRG